MNESKEGVQYFYKDLEMIGKHYLIYSEGNKSKKRHYTICNVLQKQTFKQYTKLIKNYLKGTKLDFE